MATSERLMTAAYEAVLREAQEAHLRQVRFLYCDNGGLIRGKATHVASLAERLVSGIGLTMAMQAFSAQDELASVPGLGPVGEIRLVPDPQTFVVLPYVPASGAMLVDMEQLDGAAWECCPRSFLRRQLNALAERFEGSLRASFEAEFSLARPGANGEPRPLDESRCFATTGMNAAADVIDAILSALEEQDLTPAQYYAELGHGQHELSLPHAEGGGAADRQVLLRETVRGVALRHGILASFAPKPWLDQAGNGAHVHLSVWSRDGRQNLFADLTAPYGLSAFGRRFAAGILAHLPALVALSCASVNSYRRLQPQMWSSAFVAWGPDNREAAVRVASAFRGSEAATVNLEYKPSDATGNPYLVLGALVAAGMDGLERALEPPEPALVDPATLSEQERQACGMTRLPGSLGQSLFALEADEYLSSQIPPKLLEAYLAVKRSEVRHFAGLDVHAELERHFAIY
jgi:glutamine synthetase